jgi:hypothetical protein
LDAATIDAERRATPMAVERICGWHRAIFLTTFESHAGRVREDHESVEFGVPVEIRGEMRDWPVRGNDRSVCDLGGSARGVRGVQHE